MPIRHVGLTEHQAALVEGLVAGGRYQNASEGLRLKALQGAVQVGLTDSAAGRYTDFNSSESLTQHLKTLAKKAIASG
jgi:antitoxin ParD1/3/4